MGLSEPKLPDASMRGARRWRLRRSSGGDLLQFVQWAAHVLQVLSEPSLTCRAASALRARPSESTASA